MDDKRTALSKLYQERAAAFHTQWQHDMLMLLHENVPASEDLVTSHSLRTSSTMRTVQQGTLIFV